MEIINTVSEEYDNQRLDQYLVESIGDDISRSSVQKWIRKGCVKLGEDVITKTGHKVYSGDILNIQIPAKPKINLEPIQMDIPIIWEDESYRIIHKKPGIATHPGPGDSSETLVNGLLYQFQQLSKGSSDERPGIIHRLDKPTEGLLIVAKNDKAHAAMSKMFQERNINKIYYAWVLQSPIEPEGTINMPIGRHPKDRLKMTIREDGRNAITHYKTIKVVNSKKGRKFSLLEINLETGRTHQIRVHMQSISCPIVGDLLYSRTGMDYKKYGLMLLAKSISFIHPYSGESVTAEIDFPERFDNFEQNAPLTF